VAEITRAMEYAYGRLPYMVPNEIRRQIGSDELLDRLVYSTSLMKRAEQERDRTAKAGFSAAASAVLTAPPREETAQLVKSLELKIERWDAYGNWGQGEQARRQLAEVQARQPMAPVRADRMTKAEKSSDLVPVYDAAGNLVGLTKPASITPVTSGAGMEKDAIAEDDDPEVARALAAGRPLGTPKDPASAEIPAAAGMPGEVAKARRPQYNVMIRRGPR